MVLRNFCISLQSTVTVGEAKSAIYNCFVPFDDKSIETSPRVEICYNYY